VGEIKKNIMCKNNITEFHPELIRANKFWCPMCKEWDTLSDYLMKIFKDNPKSLWFANMVTHYRHSHITSWNKCWGYGGKNYRRGWFKDYEDEKSKVNERAKRQILRKCKEFMKFHKFSTDDILILENNSSKTIELANKILPKNDIELDKVG
jgi:hypothetical protein